MPVSPTAAKPSALSVFRNQNFTLMWTGQLVSTVGTALTSLVASIYVFRVTGSALSVGLMMMATALPSFFVGLVAGVLVDRYDRRRIMLLADLARAVVIVLIPVLVSVHIAWLYILVALSSALGQFFDPAYAAMLPEIASDDELAAANSMVTISSIGAQAIGFALSGLIAARSIEWAFYIDALTFLFSAGCVTFLRVGQVQAEGETNVPTILRNLRAGFQVIRDTPPLRSLFLVYLPVFILYGLSNSLNLPFVVRALHATEAEYGLLEGVGMIGIVLGSLVMAYLGDRLREGQWISISFLGMAAAWLVYSQLQSVPVAIALSIVNAFFNAPSVVGRQVLIQRNTPRDMRGRVSSAFFVMRDTVFLVGMAMVGLADIVDVRLMVVVSGLAFLAVGSLALVLPGLGQPAAEWKRALHLLRGAKAAPRLGVGRAAALADFDRLIGRVPALAVLTQVERQDLAARTLVTEAAPGTIVVYKGERSNNVYFILDGQAVAGHVDDDDYELLEVLNPGDFFGEIAALTNLPRTANVITETATTLLQVPSQALREMTKHPALNRLFLSKMTERMVRMNMIDIPRYAGLDQEALRELRTPPAGA